LRPHRGFAKKTGDLSHRFFFAHTADRDKMNS
jgi:hypothetical protein